MKRFLVIIFASTVILAACGEIETNMSVDVQDFESTTQSNEPLTLKDLEGDWWIADFVFTNCTTVCLPMTSNMAKLQEEMKQENLDAQIISFSVDPEYDTPDVLKEFAESYQADLSNWSFVTGYDFETIKEFSEESFKSVVNKPPEGSDQVSHGTSFFLVNPDGEVIKRYSGTNQSEIEEIIADLKKVL